MPIISSTLLLTLLMTVGLLFFVRASVKERLETQAWQVNQSELDCAAAVEAHFLSRAYQVVGVDPQENRVTLRGFVAPSRFMAVFLSLLAGCGCLCLALMLTTLWPPLGPFTPLLVLGAPLAGWFYWQRAGRYEEVLVRFEAPHQDQCRLVVTGHRDELAVLGATLGGATSD